ncbi:glycerate kinase [Evansella caseinilytica]|uniref:Glycerate kinase n=1 Tax=Evansella caseinilytica TaxID=1503961 RepID=A0A1H3UFI6_9BACI|nr:glycerate kinase [Evansella caseinilytica]SDZ61184.1 glycerate kinase [Evansella caseinilytica]
MIKKIVIAPDSFKESVTAKEAAEAIERGFRSVYSDAIDVDLIPMADGGEGTTQSLADALKGEIHEKVVSGPLGTPVKAVFAVSGDKTTAVIEMAEASGLGLVPKEKRNPLLTTTYGTGELIKAALDLGVSKIILGIGGSATNDGGAGMIEALGGGLYEENGKKLSRGGAALKKLAQLDLTNMDPRLNGVEVIVACDVNNPLLGPDGASAVYGPQKGATDAMVAELDEALKHYNEVLVQVTGNDVKDVPGAGAAGGLGTGLMACLGARLERGVEIILNETRFRERISDASLVITGEGRMDGQTIHGKTPIGVAKAAKENNLPVIALCGTLGKGHEAVFEHGIDAVFSIVPGPCNVEEAIKNGSVYLESLAGNVAKLLKMGAVR